MCVYIIMPCIPHNMFYLRFSHSFFNVDNFHKYLSRDGVCVCVHADDIYRYFIWMGGCVMYALGTTKRFGDDGDH